MELQPNTKRKQMPFGDPAPNDTNDYNPAASEIKGPTLIHAQNKAQRQLAEISAQLEQAMRQVQLA
jgi:hypothetical protein